MSLGETGAGASSVVVTSAGKVSPNMGSPLWDWERVASSWMTSQCSASSPSATRTMSVTIQLVGWPIWEKRPCKIT